MLHIRAFVINQRFCYEEKKIEILSRLVSDIKKKRERERVTLGELYERFCAIVLQFEYIDLFSSLFDIALSRILYFIIKVQHSSYRASAVAGVHVLEMQSRTQRV